MERWTYEEYLVRLAWLDEQWNKPDRRSYELARIAQRVIQVAVKAEHQRDIKLEDQMVRFDLVQQSRDKPEGELPPLKLMDLPSDHPLVLQAKMRWNAALRPPKEKR